MVARLQRLAALAVSVTVLAGIPYLLLVVLTWPSLDLSWVMVEVYLRSGRLPPGVLTTVLMAVLWGAWGIYLLAVLAEAHAWIRHSGARPRPLGPLRMLVATALGTMATTSATHPALAETVTATTEHPGDDTAEETEPHAPTEEETEPVYELRERSRTINGFGYDSATVTEEMKADLQPTVGLIANHGASTVPVVITGHTDAAGDTDYNQSLSERRAEAVADYLRSQLGEDAPPISTRGQGEEDPLPDAGDAAQRRVDITYTITTPASHDPEPPPPTSEPDPTTDSTRDQTVVLQLPSGATISLAAGAAAAAGAAGGYALGARRRPTSTQPHSSPTTEDTPKTPPTHPHPPPHHETSPRHPQNAEPSTSIALRVVEEMVRTPGIGVTGPETDAAARALLATALRTDPTQPRLRVVLCAEDAQRLLGEQTATLLTQRRTPAVMVVDSFTAAMTALHTEAIERQHQLAEADVDSLAELRTTAPTQATQSPPLILLTSPPLEQEADLAALLLTAHDLDITAVVLGRWPLGGTLTVERNQITETSPPLAHLRGARWPAITRQTITDLLAAHPPNASRPPVSAPQGDPPQGPSQPLSEEAGSSRKEEPQRPSKPTTAAPPQGLAPEDEDAEHPHLSPELRTAPPAPAAESQKHGEEETPHYAPEDNREEATAQTAPEPPPAAEEENAPQPHPVYLRLMGRVRLTVEGSRVELPRHAAYELAAYLALHPDGVSLERAIDEMWPQEDPRRTHRRFHDAARTLRQITRSSSQDNTNSPVLREAEVYRINPAVVGVDLWELEEALDQANQDEPSAQHLQRVMRLYAGELAAEADYAWIEPARTALRRRITHVLRQHADTHPHLATAVLERVLEADPADEELHAAVIKLHLAHGDTEAARNAYMRYTEEMRRLGAPPSPRLHDLIDPTDKTQ